MKPKANSVNAVFNLVFFVFSSSIRERVDKVIGQMKGHRAIGVLQDYIVETRFFLSAVSSKKRVKMHILQVLHLPSKGVKGIS
jgi:hypothetical protein